MDDKEIAAELLNNASRSIMLGIEDYREYKNGAEARMFSAIRNLHAGVLLLGKAVLVHTALKAKPEIIIAARYKPKLNKRLRLDFDKDGTRTVNFEDIKIRFASFGLDMEEEISDSLDELSKIRNDVEHLYSLDSYKKMKDAITNTVPIIRNFFYLLENNPTLSGITPSDYLGKRNWNFMLREEKQFKKAKSKMTTVSK